MFVAAAIEPVHVELEARFEQARGLDDAAKGIAVGPRVGRVDELREGPAVAGLALVETQVGELAKDAQRGWQFGVEVAQDLLLPALVGTRARVARPGTRDELPLVLLLLGLGEIEGGKGLD